MKSSNRIKVKTTIIIDMEVNDAYTLEQAIEDLAINVKSNHPDSSFVYNSELTYYEPLY